MREEKEVRGRWREEIEMKRTRRKRKTRLVIENE
jgi:hypothetical protein